MNCVFRTIDIYLKGEKCTFCSLFLSFLTKKIVLVHLDKVLFLISKANLKHFLNSITYRRQKVEETLFYKVLLKTASFLIGPCVPLESFRYDRLII